MMHGGNIFEFAKSCGCKEKDVIDFSSNINPRTPAYSFKDVNISPYAEPTYEALHEKLASVYKLESSQIALYNGASSAIFSLFEMLKPKISYLYAPLYGEYERAASLYSKEIELSNRFDDIYELPPKKSLVVFVNPSTPDGRYYDLKKLFRIWKIQKCRVLIDESFLPFSSKKSIRKLISKNKNLYVVQSLSKIYGSAGIRIGALFSHEKNIGVLKKRQVAWGLSSLDVSFMLGALSDEKHLKKSSRWMDKRKTQLEKILHDSGLFSKIYDSSANFILVKLSSLDAQTLQQKLMPHRILIRDCTSFDFLDSSYVRFALKDKHSHKKLKKALNALT